MIFTNYLLQRIQYFLVQGTHTCLFGYTKGKWYVLFTSELADQRA